jgi:CBS domain containing-hemolysin-like protein
VGVTLASLGLGWAGENTLYEILLKAFHPLLTPVTSTMLHGAALILSFIIISYFHVVLGEVVPKNLAIENADRLSILHDCCDVRAQVDDRAAL